MIYFIEKFSNLFVFKFMSGNCCNNGIEMIFCDRVVIGSICGIDLC